MFAHDRIGLATNVGRFAFAVALATLHSGDSIAQGQPRQITKTDIFGSGIKKSTTRKSAPGVPGVPDKRNRGELVAGPNIKSFTARRTPSGIAISAVFNTVALNDIPNVRFKISHLDSNTAGEKWSELKSGVVTIPGQREARIDFNLPATANFVRLKLEASADAPVWNATKNAEVPGQTVVTWSTNGWVLAFEEKYKVDPSRILSQNARKRAAELANYGFKSQIRFENSSPIIGSDTRVDKLYVRTEKPQMRVFEQFQEGRDFAMGLESLVKDKEGISVQIR